MNWVQWHGTAGFDNDYWQLFKEEISDNVREFVFITN